MKKTARWCAIVVIFAGALTMLARDGFAIGFWHDGVVTRAPLVEKYTYLQIDNVRYTIMEDAKIVEVYEKNGAFYKEIFNVYSILIGHRLVYKSEGNRIYQIEKIR